MIHFRSLLLLSLSAISVAASAADLGAANKFNGFIFSSATTNGGHSDGAVAVGTTWTGSGYDVLQSNLPGTMGAFTKVGLIVGQSLSYSNGGSINNSGTGHIGTSLQTQNPYNVNGGSLSIGTTKTGPVNGSYTTGTNTVVPNFFSDQYSYSLSQSNALKALGGTAINTSNPNNWSLTATSGFNVFTINASALSNLRTLDISGLTSTSTLLINVVGSSVNAFGVTVNTNTGGYEKLLWNFADATYLNVRDRAFHGSILAPRAVVDQYQNIDGNLIASSWNNYNSAELHFGAGKTFTGNLQAVPEPSTVAALALGGLVLVRRRRK